MSLCWHLAAHPQMLLNAAVTRPVCVMTVKMRTFYQEGKMNIGDDTGSSLRSMFSPRTSRLVSLIRTAHFLKIFMTWKWSHFYFPYTYSTKKKKTENCIVCLSGNKEMKGEGFQPLKRENTFIQVNYYSYNFQRKDINVGCIFLHAIAAILLSQGSLNKMSTFIWSRVWKIPIKARRVHRRLCSNVKHWLKDKVEAKRAEMRCLPCS